ncbi:GGDEF domain-containing protein [Arsukibacterium indicum]|uniref:diguanylate cyclase n=1 Tax=Arsukibacterium indicum TaxID=2848612 RepID=A0ABS6MKA0_9GAMM|nr:GGDEF domain-containing protein [Arsukibacterium indicum]MBV2129015.1 GGDEF domain-containing protein [Arsukibacterium indicum]
MGTRYQPHKYLNLLLLLLGSATLLVLVWHQFAAEAVLAITTDSPYTVEAVDDRSVIENEESSRVKLTRENGQFIVDCTIGEGYEWPFCEFQVILGYPPGGLNLTRYDSVRIKMWVEDQSDFQMRLFLRNFNPAYSTVGNFQSLKLQELAFKLGHEQHSYAAKLSQFTVASWWSNQFPLTIEHAGADISNVSVLSVATSGHVQPGRYRIVIESIEFTGQLISEASLRLVIILVWTACIFLYLVLDSVLTRRELALSRHHHISLSNINEALLIEKDNFAQMALYDPLTGVLNRRGLSDALMDRLQNEESELSPWSIVFMDIDHFKNINDKYGHAVGDQVIEQFTAQVQRQIKRNDLLTRWGGEEFLLILPGTHSTDALEVVERLRDHLTTFPWPKGLKLTCSFGVTEYSINENLSVAIKRADEAMYTAKQKGRDRVEVRQAC